MFYEEPDIISLTTELSPTYWAYWCYWELQNSTFHLIVQLWSHRNLFPLSRNGFTQGKRIPELEQFPKLWCGLKLSKVLSHLLSLSAGEKKCFCSLLSAKNPLNSPAGTHWFGILSRESYCSFSGSKEKWEGLRKRQKFFSRVFFQLFLSFLLPKPFKI